MRCDVQIRNISNREIRLFYLDSDGEDIELDDDDIGFFKIKPGEMIEIKEFNPSCSIDFYDGVLEMDLEITPKKPLGRQWLWTNDLHGRVMLEIEPEPGGLSNQRVIRGLIAAGEMWRAQEKSKS